MSKKDKMWIACCGCGKPIHIPETAELFIDMPSTPTMLVWKSTCPHCGFTHRIELTKWID